MNFFYPHKQQPEILEAIKLQVYLYMDMFGMLCVLTSCVNISMNIKHVARLGDGAGS